MIKIAIAGSSGLAQFIAHFLSTKTCHQFVLLSRNPNPRLSSMDWQVLQVDYTQDSQLRYLLAGVDVVISTVSGDAELALIDAAAQVQVRRFIPSEFEGPPSKRLVSNIFDRGKLTALSRLQYYQENHGMEYTVLVCGIFYENFAPGGLNAFQVGKGTHADEEGDFLMDVRSAKVDVPFFDPCGPEPMICVTSVQDVAQFLVAALDLPKWPTELRMCGDRMSLATLARTAELVKGQEFAKDVYPVHSFQQSLESAKATGNLRQQRRLYNLMAAAHGCYDFENPNLHDLVDVQPQRFQEWLQGVWS